MRPDIIQIALLSTNHNALQLPHIPWSRAQILETCDELDEAADEGDGDFATDTFVGAEAVGREYAAWAAWAEFERVGDGFGVTAGDALEEA